MYFDDSFSAFVRSEKLELKAEIAFIME